MKKFSSPRFFFILPSAFSILISLTLFLSFSLYQLDLPGFYYDEAFDLTPMLNLMHGEPTELLRGIGLTVGHTSYPVMRMDYMGSLNGYLTVPFMAVFGAGYMAARIEPIFFACITIVLAFILAQRWFGWKVACVTVLLLSVNPSFIWFTRQGITVTSIMTVFSLGSWVLLDIGRKRLHTHLSSTLPVFLAGLCLGLGIWAKINFVWWIALTGILGAVWYITQPRTSTLSPPSSPLPAKRHLFILALGLLLGAAPFIYYNLAGLAQGQTPATLGLLFKALSNSTENGVNNANFLGNVQKRFQDFATFLNGSYFWFFTFTFGNVLAVPTFIISLIVGSLLMAFEAIAQTRIEADTRPASTRTDTADTFDTSDTRLPSHWRKWLALLLCIVLYLPISAFTVSDLWATHFYPILPLPQMMMACAAVWLGESVGRVARRVKSEERKAKSEAKLHISRLSPLASRLSPLASRLSPLASRLSLLALTLALLAPTFARDIWVNQQYHAQLGKTGGSGRFSDAIYKLAAHLDSAQVAEPIALDWGIAAQTRVLTADRVRPREIFGFSAKPSAEFRQQARELLKDPTRQYIVLWSGNNENAGFAVYNRRQEFTRLAHDMGRQVTEIFIAHERSGLPVYVVLQAKQN